MASLYHNMMLNLYLLTAQLKNLLPAIEHVPWLDKILHVKIWPVCINSDVLEIILYY